MLSLVFSQAADAISRNSSRTVFFSINYFVLKFLSLAEEEVFDVIVNVS